MPNRYAAANLTAANASRRQQIGNSIPNQPDFLIELASIRAAVAVALVAVVALFVPGHARADVGAADAITAAGHLAIGQATVIVKAVTVVAGFGANAADTVAAAGDGADVGAGVRGLLVAVISGLEVGVVVG